MRTLAVVVLRQVVSLVGLGQSPDAKDIEIAVLRHQLLVLRRQVARPCYTPADRMLLATLAKLLPRDRWPVFLVTPSNSASLAPRADPPAWNRRHLERVLTDYIRHYNTARPHRGIDLDVPVPPADFPPTTQRVGRIERVDVIGGLIHEYRHAA